MGKIDDEIKTKFVDNRHRFITNVIYTATWFQNRFAKTLKPHGLSMEQFNVLRILRGAKDWKSMNDIKELMIHKTPNTTRLSDKLLEKGLVKRKRSAVDRRVVYLNITDKGQQLLTKIDEEENMQITRLFEVLSPEEAQHFSDILDELREE